MLLSPLRYINPISGNRGGSAAFSIAKSFYLDGVDEEFSLGNEASLNSFMVGTNLQFTILFAVKRSELARLQGIFSKDDVSLNRSFWMRFQTTNAFEFICNDTFSNKTDKWAGFTNTTDFYIGALVYDYTDAGVITKLYCNGSLVTKTSQALINGNINSTSSDYIIAGDDIVGGSTFNYNGYINQIATLNIPITEAQYLSWYNNGKPKDAQALFGSNCKYFFNPDNSGDTAQFTVTDSVNSITATSVNMEDADKTTITPY